ncbi:MAG: ABC transporter transmembrane domain-containing protein, partial [Pseudomonadota bacterium]
MEEPRAKSKSVGSLRALAPFILPYRGMAFAALAALVMTAALSLVLPLAVRRVIDGFAEKSDALLDLYFAAAVVLAGALAVATALRFWLVTTLGERIIADIRRAVYDHVIGMSPHFYEKLMSGEVISRLTTDTTVILSVISSSISVALRNALLFVGGLGMMVLTSPKLAGFTMLIVPVVVIPILTLGRRVRRLSRESQDRIADSSAQASETLSAAQTVQAYTAEGFSRARFGDLTEQSFDAARRRVAVRAWMTAIVIFLVFTGVVGVLWIGAKDVRAGAMSPGELAQFLIYAVIVSGAVGAL